VITCRALHRVAALDAPNQTYSASKWSIFNRPIWKEFTRRRQQVIVDLDLDEIIAIRPPRGFGRD
jgi:hypothetical protein